MIRVILGLLFLATPIAEAQALYQTQDAAQHACPKDTVVWLNTRSDVYHFQGERWYNNTEEGDFVCEKTPMQMVIGRPKMDSSRARSPSLHCQG